MSWTQAICNDCWDERNPERKSPRKNTGMAEKCCWCGFGTCSGIYVREDPKVVPYPS